MAAVIELAKQRYQRRKRAAEFKEAGDDAEAVEGVKLTFSFLGLTH